MGCIRVMKTLQERVKWIKMGEQLGAIRVLALGISGRALARKLKMSSSYYWGIENGDRNPGEKYLKPLNEICGLPFPEMRAGWDRLDPFIKEVILRNATNCYWGTKIIVMARNFNKHQWELLVEAAKRIREEGS